MSPRVKPKPRPMEGRTATSWHEAAHALVAIWYGCTDVRATVLSAGDGHCQLRLPPLELDALANLRMRVQIALAGRCAVRLARGYDLAGVDPVTLLELEPGIDGPNTYAEILDGAAAAFGGNRELGVRPSQVVPLERLQPL